MPRRNSVASSSRTLRPSIVMSPWSKSISRLTSFIAVVFPAPDGPTSTQISPAGTTSERCSTAAARRPGYRFVTSLKTISAAALRVFRSAINGRRRQRRHGQEVEGQRGGTGTAATQRLLLRLADLVEDRQPVAVRVVRA